MANEAMRPGLLFCSMDKFEVATPIFYYTGSYTFRNGKWRGEIITHQHTEAVGKNLAFGGREVNCGFTGLYSDGEAEVDGTALVGKPASCLRRF
jgi:hypothetical protein